MLNIIFTVLIALYKTFRLYSSHYLLILAFNITSIIAVWIALVCDLRLGMVNIQLFGEQ
jgi:hypothetical protein